MKMLIFGENETTIVTDSGKHVTFPHGGLISIDGKPCTEKELEEAMGDPPKADLVKFECDKCHSQWGVPASQCVKTLTHGITYPGFEGCPRCKCMEVCAFNNSDL